MSQQSFADLGVSAAVCGALSARGITEPFAIQRLVIADVLAGRDVLGKSPTGSGKTLAFAVPLVERIAATDRRPAALILAPTRELASQIVEESRHVAHARALKISAVYGGVGLEKQAREAAKSQILVATPGRLEDLIQRRAITLEHVKVLILDEADRMLDMGFRPAIDRIVAMTPRDRQTLFFSATLDGEAGRVARTYTQDPVQHEHQPTQRSTAAIEHRFVAVERDDRMDVLIRALRVSAVYGGVGYEKQTREAARSHVVVATPGRLEDLLDRRAFSLGAVQVLVLDEAVRMLDMGFRPAVDRIVAQVPADRQTLFFSATLDGEAGRIAQAYTHDARRHEHRPEPVDVTPVEHRFVRVTHDERVPALVGELRADRDLALVFVRTKRGADRLVKKLGREGVEAVAMHGDKSQGQRERALQSFESGRVSTLVATDVAARGIDVDGITHVINFDAPEDREGYVHRVGRTGRAGRGGVGITFVAEEQAGDVAKIAADLQLDREFARTGFSSTATAGARRPRARSRSRRGR